MSFSLNSERKRGKYFGFAAFLVLFGLLDQAEAQSGRRSTKAPSSTTSATPTLTATEPPDSETLKQPAPGELQDQVRLLIARQSTSKHLQSEDVITASFIKRLNEYANVAGTSIGDLKHAQAVKRAKAEMSSFVVLLSFDIDNVQHGTIILNSPDLQIGYLVLAPRTGKKQAMGKIYFQAIGGARMRRSDWPNGTPIKITPEAAGIEAADHIYDWLRLEAARKR
jgi:hypothetical protein